MTGFRGATRRSIIPQPTRCKSATLPKRPVNRHETELIEVDRQLRRTARAVAIRARSISYCEPFAIAKSSRVRSINTPSALVCHEHVGALPSAAAYVQEPADSVARCGRDHADH